MKRLYSGIACAAAPMMLLAACNDRTDDARERVEDAAENSAVAAGPAEAALGLSEQQLLDADLVDATGKDLGDVEAVLRDGTGRVDRLLVEIEDTNPDKLVHVPIAGIQPVQKGNDWDLTTTMTREQLLALPDAPLPAVTGAPTTAPAVPPPAPATAPPAAP